MKGRMIHIPKSAAIVLILVATITVVAIGPLYSQGGRQSGRDQDGATAETRRPQNAGGGVSAALVGEVRMWAGLISTIPDGWLFCDGAEISRATYADLFSVVGTIYGEGDGSTTFGLPDFRDRSPMGATQDDTGVPKTNVGGGLTQSGGEAQHTLTIAEMPAHTHEINAANPFDICIQCAGTEEHTDTQVGTTEASGGDGPHNNLHPYFAITYMIFAGGDGGCLADLNDDNSVDAFDLALLLGNWGPCL